MPSYYETLGVGENASREEIQAAYDSLMKQSYAGLRNPKTHDDCIEKIKQVTQAGKILLDAQSRKRYDEDEKLAELDKVAPPSPWRRFFARCIDQAVFVAIVYSVYRYFADYVFFEDWVFFLSFMGVSIAAYILLETALVSFAGTTLGKWMLSVQTKSAEGKKPGWLLLAKRNLMVSLLAYGLYIPPFCIIALAVQYVKYRKNESKTPWDRACATAVGYDPIRKNRLWLLVPIILLLLVDLADAL